MTDMSATAAHGETAASPADDRPPTDQATTPTYGEAEPLDMLAGPHAEARRRAEDGDLTGARTMLEEALADGELRLGRHDPRLAPLMVDLATIARNLGNLTEAQAQLRRAYGIVVATSGPDNATALSIEGRLAAVTYRLGEPTEPYDWHLTNVGGRVLGPDHPAIRGALQRLSMAQAMPSEAPPFEGPPFEGSEEYEPEEPTEREPAEPGFAPHYVPSSHSAGVYDRMEPPAHGPPDPAGIYVVGPPPRTYQQVEVQDEPPMPRPRPSRKRGHGGGVALVASLGLTIFVAAVVIAMQLFGPGAADPNPGAAGDPTAGPTSEAAPTGQPATTVPVDGRPPTDVALRDEGGSVTLTWVDPSGGRVSFVVSGGREDTTAGLLETVPVGRTTATIYGLNIRYDYCFTVAAVWSADVIAPSIRTCTNRLPPPSAR
jgi:hypothetical protein